MDASTVQAAVGASEREIDSSRIYCSAVEGPEKLNKRINNKLTSVADRGPEFVESGNQVVGVHGVVDRS